MLKNSIVAVAAALALTAFAAPAEGNAEPTVRAAATCQSGYYCLYAGPNFDGAMVKHVGTGCHAIRTGALPNGARSVQNRSTFTVEIFNRNGRLLIPTLSPGASDSGINTTTAAAMGDICAFG